MIEEDAERYNHVITGRFSEQTDTALQSLKNSMIHMLSASNLRSLLLSDLEAHSDDQQRAELLHSLREQLHQLESDPLVERAYFRFVHADLIVDAETYTNLSYYISNRFPYSLSQWHLLEEELNGKKMMDFTHSSDSITTLMSFPFNTVTPEVYLIVDLDPDRLKEQILISESWVIGTAIMDSLGRIIAQSGLSEQDKLWMTEYNLNDRMASQFSIENGIGLSSMKSEFDPSWTYVVD